MAQGAHDAKRAPSAPPSSTTAAAPDEASAIAKRQKLLADVDARCDALAANALAEASRKTADTAERSFTAFLRELDITVGPQGLSDRDLSRYIAYLTLRPSITAFSTIKNYVSMGVRRWHQQRDLPWIGISERFHMNAVMTGARRTMSDAPSQQKLPITVELLSDMRKQMNIGKSSDACLFAAFTVSFYCLLRKGNVVADKVTKSAAQRGESAAAGAGQQGAREER